MSKKNITSDIDIYKVPVPRWHGEDGDRYINTYQATIMTRCGQHNLLFIGMGQNTPSSLRRRKTGVCV